MSISLLAVHHGGAIGGAPVSLLKLLQRLDPTAFEVHAVFTEPGDSLSYARQLGVPASLVRTGGAFFYSAHARLAPRTMARCLATFATAVQTAQRALRMVRPDVVHLNTSVLLAWAAAARRERLPVVWTVREVLGPQPLLRRWHGSYILRHARRVVAISDAVRECFPDSPKLRRVYNAVDLADFDPSLDAEQAKRQLGIRPGRQVVMVIGSVQRAKGHWLVLEALRKLSPAVDLVLVTGGAGADYASSWRGRLKRALGVPLDNLDALLRDASQMGLRDRIQVTGFRTDVGRLLAAADVLAFPSLAPEGFGRPIIEAMAAGRAVIATDIGPSRELLGAQAGRLVSPNPRELAAAVDELLRAPEIRARMGLAGRQRAEACFSLDRQVAEMSAIYREAAALG